ncbi:MAG: hypothetical protein IT250_01055 [Chitinophagaceae bacterium]|nr:hypothetical protein [Chitinophagaceae bacterium]
MSGLKPFLPSVCLFLLLSGLILLVKRMLPEYGFDVTVLLWGNGFMLGLSVISFLLQHKAAKSASPQVIVRYFYISFMVKLLLVATIALLYAKTTTNVSKISVITCMVFYLLYTFIEIGGLIKTGKQKNA